jgi:hypothetical protein
VFFGFSLGWSFVAVRRLLIFIPSIGLLLGLSSLLLIVDARRIHSQGRRFDLSRVARSFLSRFAEIPTLVEEPEPFPTMSGDYEAGSVLEALADNTDECSDVESVHPGSELESITNLEITKRVSTFEATWRHDDDEQASATLEREIDGLRDPIDRLSARQDDLTRWSLDSALHPRTRLATLYPFRPHRESLSPPKQHASLPGQTPRLPAGILLAKPIFVFNAS